MPHEALHEQEDGSRQFFRLVISDISVWYAAHSTSCPNVPVPSHAKIISESIASSRAQEWYRTRMPHESTYCSLCDFDSISGVSSGTAKGKYALIYH